MIDEDAAHRLGGDGEEVGATLPIDAGLIDQFHVSFVDQCGGLQSVALRFASHATTGHQAQFRVDPGRETSQSGFVAGSPRQGVTEDEKEDALSELAKALAASDPDRAERIAHTITNEYLKASALSAIAWLANMISTALLSVW